MENCVEGKSAVDTYLDSLQAEGMLADGDDWSSLPNSRRKDRVLPREVVMQLTQKNNYRGVIQFLGNLGISAGIGFAILKAVKSGSYLATALAVIVQGFVLCSGGFAGMHECIHFTAFKSRIMNQIFGFLMCLPAGSFFEHELLMHKDHHTYTGDPKRDTEILCLYGEDSLKPGFRKIPSSRREYVIGFAMAPIRETRIKILKFINCALGRAVDYTGTSWVVPTNPDHGKPTLRDRLQKAAWYHIIAYALLVPVWLRFLGFRSMFWCWLLPMFVGPAPLWYLQIGEHADCSTDSNGLTNTRTVLVNRLVRFVYWNMNYHAEHHLYTTIPYHALPLAHSLLRGHIKNVSTSYQQLNYDVYTSYIPKQQAGIPVVSA